MVDVSYGYIEPLPLAEFPTRYEGRVTRTGRVELEPRPQIGRKRFETWRENGEKMGRWDWEVLR